MLWMCSPEVKNNLLGFSHIKEEIVVLMPVDHLAHLVFVVIVVSYEAHHSFMIRKVIWCVW